MEFSPSGDSVVVVGNVFDETEPLNCSLKFNIKEFTKSKNENRIIPAVFTWYKNDSVTISRDINIEARGQSRKEICYFPPIKLKFKNTSIDDPYLDQVKTQKLVTHCNSSKNYEQYLLKEYLAYKIYNILSEQSFRVMLIKMNYIDAGEKVEPFTRFAFLIEDVDVLCDRNKCIELENKNLGMRHIDTISMIRFSLFQFMIGNVDWTIPDLHNVKLLKALDITRQLPDVVPYDFDHSGFVNASYAVNVRDPEIGSVKTRVFAGLCFSEADYLEQIQEFISLKDEFYTTITEFEFLDAKHKKAVVNYIDEFFQLIDQPNFYKKYILPECEGIK
jgi:hypothetical protein